MQPKHQAICRIKVNNNKVSREMLSAVIIKKNCPGNPGQKIKKKNTFSF